MDYAKLKIEINTDPTALGYAGKEDAAIADLLATLLPNSVLRTMVPAKQLTGDMAIILATLDQYPDATPVPVGVPPTATIPFLKSLVKYTINADVVNVASPTSQQMFGIMEVYGMMTSADAFNLTHCDGTRAEVVLGVGVSVTQADISFALRGVR